MTTRNGVRRGNYRFLSTLKAQDLTRLNPDIIGEIREMHPLLTTKLNNITLRHAVKDYLSSYVKDKRFIILKYGEIGDWDVSNVTNMIQLFEGARTQQLGRVQREHYGTDVLDRNILQPAAQQLGRVLRGGYGLDVYGLIVLQPTAQ